MKRKSCFCLIVMVFMAIFRSLAALAAPSEQLDYGDENNWAVIEREEQEERAADVFLIAPTVSSKDKKESGNEDAEDEEWREAVQKSLAWQLGLFKETAACFAPYYRQATLAAYRSPAQKKEECLKLAYLDVRAAFGQYLLQNPRRPFILAGLGQGGEMVVRLLKERSIGRNKKLRRRLIAAYAGGCCLTVEEAKNDKGLKPAAGELDNDCLIIFTTEAPAIEESPLLPKGSRTVAVNPLNWQTDGTPATRQQNLGACIFDGEGKLLREEKHFTGAYIDRERGTVKVPYVDPGEYKVSYLPAGVYAPYDWQFCFRNLQKNVKDRTTAYLERQKKL